MVLGFCIVRCIRDAKHTELCYDAYTSIRKFYPNNHIMIIDDNSTVEDLHEYDNITMIKSEHPGCGEVLAYYYFHKLRLFDEMVFIHDSMMINSVLDLHKTPLFLWNFTTHIWDDVPRVCRIIQDCKHKFQLTQLMISQCWDGCFGICSYVTLEFIDTIERKYNFFSVLNHIKCRDDRCSMERIWSIICHHHTGKRVIPTICGNIFDHPDSFGPYNPTDPRLEKLPIIKRWMGR